MIRRDHCFKPCNQLHVAMELMPRFSSLYVSSCEGSCWCFLYRSKMYQTTRNIYMINIISACAPWPKFEDPAYAYPARRVRSEQARFQTFERLEHRLSTIVQRLAGLTLKRQLCCLCLVSFRNSAPLPISWQV